MSHRLTAAEWEYSCAECGHTARSHSRFEWDPEDAFQRTNGLLTGTLSWRCQCGCTGRQFSKPEQLAGHCPQSGVLTVNHDAGDELPCPVCGQPLQVRTDWRFPRHQRPVQATRNRSK
jgi:hypothetical protein